MRIGGFGWELERWQGGGGFGRRFRDRGLARWRLVILHVIVQVKCWSSRKTLCLCFFFSDSSCNTKRRVRVTA